MDKNEKFNYTYSSQNKEEIEQIVKKYKSEKDEPDKMERLRALDRATSRPGTTAAIVIGTISTLVMGIGMSMIMSFGKGYFIPGIIIGVIGMAGVVAAYPLYSFITEREKKKAAPEILRLSEELLGK